MFLILRRMFFCCWRHCRFLFAGGTAAFVVGGTAAAYLLAALPLFAGGTAAFVTGGIAAVIADDTAAMCTNARHCRYVCVCML